MTESDEYLLGRSQREEERLRKQDEEIAGEARWLLDQLEIRPGARALELGCGPQGVMSRGVRPAAMPAIRTAPSDTCYPPEASR